MAHGISLEEVQGPKVKYIVEHKEIAVQPDDATQKQVNVLTSVYNVGRNKAKRATRKPYGMPRKVWAKP